jgi:predicted DNA-binding protein with PD1-like motif
MRSKLLDEAGGRSWVLVFETGDELTETLLAFAREHGVTAADFTAIGAFETVTLAYFDWERKEYEEHLLDDQVEVLALTGNLATEEGEPRLHAHVAVGLPDTSVRGGHLVRAVVRPTLELFLREAATRLVKAPDEATGLSLIDPDAG